LECSFASRWLETPSFAKVKENVDRREDPHSRGVLAHASAETWCWRMGARFAENVSFYLFTAWILDLRDRCSWGCRRNVALNGLLAASALEFRDDPRLRGAVRPAGAAARVHGGAAALTGLLAFPAFWLIETRVGCP